MQKKQIQKFESLMRKSLDNEVNSKKRVDSFKKLFEAYIKIDGEGTKWNDFRIKLRKKFSKELNNEQKKEYALTKNRLKKSYFEIKKNIPQAYVSYFPVELFYEISYSMIKKISQKGEKILDIGYGDFPILVNILNKKGYDAYGIDPFAKKFDNKKTFKNKICKLPEKIKNLRFNIILVNMVYSLNYTSQYSKNFKYELEYKKEILKKLSELLENKGFLILIDDIGTIFSKFDLNRYFKVLFFEKDIEIINFKTKKVEDLVKITLLIKK